MNLQAVFRSTAQAPLDNRQVVQTKADLINANTFEGFAYEGMLVVVAATSTVYVLSDISKVTASDYSGWTELATSASASASASVVAIDGGENNAYVELTTTTAADGHKIYTLDLKTVDLADATDANTGVADAYDVKSYVDSAIDGIEAIIEDNEEVVASALNELKDTTDDHETRISAIEGEIGPDGLIKDYTVTITSPVTPTEGYLKTYTFSQLGSEIGKIDIPKDLVVTEGKTVEVVYDATAGHYYDEASDPTHQTAIDSLLNLDEQQTAGYAAGMYIRLSIANQASPLYIKVTSLVDIYTGDSTSTNNITVTVDPNTNVISAGVGANSALQAALTKVDGIASGAQVNVLEGVQVDGVDLTITNKKVNISTANITAAIEAVATDLEATNANVEKVEKVASAALNDLNSRLVDTENAIANLPHIPATYITDAITDSAARTITVTAAVHGCGSFPLVQVYAGNEVVNANITVDIASNSDVTVTWEIVPSVSAPIRVRILG